MASLRPVNFDGSFELEESKKEQLFKLLESQAFQQQICQNAGCTKVTFLSLIFQPVPYSENTPHGMNREFEPYFKSKEHIIINVPANFMFQAKITQPSRLCAIYRKDSAAD
jgi:hypothetical protein